MRQYTAIEHAPLRTCPCAWWFPFCCAVPEPQNHVVHVVPCLRTRFPRGVKLFFKIQSSAKKLEAGSDLVDLNTSRSEVAISKELRCNRVRHSVL